MRIAIFSESWYPYISGVNRSIEIFKMELEKRGHRIFLFVPGSGRINQEDEDIFRFASIPAVFNPGYRLPAPISPRLNRTLKELDVDLIHAQAPMIMGRTAMSSSRRLGLPLVFTHHTLYDLYIHYAGPLAGLAAPYLNSYVRRFANKCDLVITPTHIVAELLAKRGITAPLKAVSTGVVLEEFEDCNRSWLCRRLDLSEKETIILCVARLGIEKNIFLLLNSFALINQSLPETRLVLAGLGPLRSKIRPYAESLGLGKKFFLLDQEFSRREMASIYSSADLFLYPSVTETQGIIINEAHAAGLPVVAVGAHGVAEMVEDGVDGLLTDAEAGSLAGAAVKVLTDQELQKHLGEGALQAARRINSGRMAEEMISAYRQVLASKGGRPEETG